MGKRQWAATRTVPRRSPGWRRNSSSCTDVHVRARESRCDVAVVASRVEQVHRQVVANQGKTRDEESQALHLHVVPIDTTRTHRRRMVMKHGGHHGVPAGLVPVVAACAPASHEAHVARHTWACVDAHGCTVMPLIAAPTSNAARHLNWSGRTSAREASAGDASVGEAEYPSAPARNPHLRPGASPAPKGLIEPAVCPGVLPQKFNLTPLSLHF